VIASVRTLAFSMALAAVASGCSKDEPAAKPEPMPTGKVSAGSPPVPPSSGSAAGAVAPGGPVGWTGSYESAAGTLYVPEGKEWEGVKFRGEKSEVGLGTGAMTIEVDPKNGITGTLDGPLGPAVVSGLSSVEAVAIRVDRKDPKDNGFVGTGLAKVNGGVIEGTMKLSQGDARVIREAKFTLKRK